MCGKQTIDGDTAQVGPGIARRMDSTQLTLVDEMISVDEVPFSPEYDVKVDYIVTEKSIIETK